MPISRINNNSIANNTIVASDLAAGSVTGDKLGLTAINANNIVNSTITTTQIASNTISNTNIATGAIENYSRATGLLSGMRNRIINGAMVIDQRNAGASVTNINGNVYPVDRFIAAGAVASKFTAQQNAGSVTPPVGFTNYLGITSLSAYTVGAGENFNIRCYNEGLNTADLGWGTANAKTVTLSFWVYSSLTGTFGGSINNYSFNRSYPYSYTITSANTWQQISVTIAGDTSGTWNTNNSGSLCVFWNLGCGATNSGPAGSWSSNLYIAPTGATSVVGTNGATFYITGVQLEVGSTATSFDYRPYGTELALCQRYYQAFFGPTTTGIGNGSTNVNDVVIPLFVPLRASPTMGSCNGAAFTSSAYNTFTSVTPTVVLNSGVFISTNQLRLNFGSVSGVTDNRIAGIRVDSNLSISSEL